MAELASDAPDLSIVASMSEMFRRATNFSGDLSNWDVSNVPWMVATFQETDAFNSDISNWNLESCNSIRFMFDQATSFNQDISNWDVSLMTELQNTFNGAIAFDQDLGDWDIDSIQNLNAFFNNSGMSRSNYDKTLIGWSEQEDLVRGVTLGATGLEYCNAINARDSVLIATANWNITGDLENCIGAAFRLAIIITDDDRTFSISPRPGYNYAYDVDWDDDGVFDDLNKSGFVNHEYTTNGLKIVNIRGEFPRFSTTTNQIIFDVAQWGEIEWASMANMFNSSGLVQISTGDAPDLSKVTSLASMFNATDFNSNINHWDVSTITDMSSMFRLNDFFNQSLDSWDVSNVEDFSSMFSGASSFNQPLDNWLMSSATDLAGMFAGTPFNHPLNDWDVSKVTDMSSMFSGSTKFNQPLENWNTSNVTTMSSMFSGSLLFNQPLEEWDVTKVESMSSMFKDSEKFNQPLNGWELDSLNRILDIFNGSLAFNQPLDNWHVSKVGSFTRAFKNAVAFDQSLGSWDLSNSSATASEFLDNCGMSVASYDQTLIGWSTVNTDASPINVEAQSLSYCQGADARQDLIEQGWTFLGDTFDASGCPSPCTPADNTYIGPIGGGWSYGVNWSLGTIPDTCSNVIIPQNKWVVIRSTESASCRIILVDENAGLEIETGGTLTSKE